MTVIFTPYANEANVILAPGFDGDEQTIWAGNVGSAGKLLQMTGKEARLIGPLPFGPQRMGGGMTVAGESGVVSRWGVEGGARRINLASVNSATGQVVAVAGKDLFYLRVTSLQSVASLKPVLLDLEVTEAEIREERQHSLDFEVACVDISPIGPPFFFPSVDCRCQTVVAHVRLGRGDIRAVRRWPVERNIRPPPHAPPPQAACWVQ